jgi:hypothetical protein
MNYEDLDQDTRNIIDGMCHNTGKTKEQAILALVELGMLSMIAAISPRSILNNKQKKIMQVIFNVVNADEKLKYTAEVYNSYWAADV